MKGENERLLYEILNDAYPGKWEREVKGIEGRRFRFDCANPTEKIAIEIDGGMYPFWSTLKDGSRRKTMVSGHSSAQGIERDMEKLNSAQLAGWKVLRYTPDTLRKRPYRIMRDIRTLCGASENNQSILCFDDAKCSPMQLQVKLGV